VMVWVHWDCAVFCDDSL